jgi:hypothetical protein
MPRVQGRRVPNGALSVETSNIKIYFSAIFNYLNVFIYCEPVSSVRMKSGYGLDDQAIEVRSPVKAKRFFL